MSDFSMTLQSCFHTSMFFSKGVMANLTLFSSMVAMSLRHCKNDMFSLWFISLLDIAFVHSGLLGILSGLYYGCFTLSSERNLFTMPAWLSKLSAAPILAGITVPLLTITSYAPYLSAVNSFLDISASCINSSSEFCSKIDLSCGF